MQKQRTASRWYLLALLHNLFVTQNVAFQPIQSVFGSVRSGYKLNDISNPRIRTHLLEKPQDDNDEDANKDKTNTVPSMDWLTSSLSKDLETHSEPGNLDFDSIYMEEHGSDADDLGDVPIPTTGISISDIMEDSMKDRFNTQLIPIKGLDPGVRAAQLVTTASAGSFEPVRYVVGLSRYTPSTNSTDEVNADTPLSPSSSVSEKDQSYVIIDVPPFSEELAAAIRSYIGPRGSISAMILTNRDGIHYSEATGVYSNRNPVDMKHWKSCFPHMEVVAYRLDIPRDCRSSITQVLDGYGPFALEESIVENEKEDQRENPKVSFIETGRPLTYIEWDFDVSQKVMYEGQAPPDDEDDSYILSKMNETEQELYTPEAIRSRENGKRILAVYTPGHSFGSISLVFPETQLCCSGFTIPVEDNRDEENLGMGGTGPALDCRGYVTTSKAGISRQMDSARALIKDYCDRFSVILPSRGDPLYLEGSVNERKQNLLELIDDYDRIGKIYEELGITSYNDD